MMVMMMMMMMMQVVLAVESIEHSRQLLADGRLREAFLVSIQARDASGLLTFMSATSLHDYRIDV